MRDYYYPRVQKGDAEHKTRISVGLGKLLDTEIKPVATAKASVLS